MAKKLIKDYVFSPGLGISDNERPNAYSLIQQNKTFLQAEIVAYIQNQVTSGNPNYVGYTYSVEKCIRDSGFVIDALLFDIQYGGNEETRRISSLYWNKEVPQIDGNRIPEYEAYQFLRDTINTNILTNSVDTSPEQLVVVQTIDNTRTAESSTTTRVSSLLNNLVLVIQDGLSRLPALIVGLGRIELLGKIGLEDLLVISNVTTNELIYNFVDPTRGGTVIFRGGNSESYPRAESVSNGTTVINFKYDTRTMSSTDSVQIFLETAELKVRPYDFGTDAIERMRVGLPQAMLDADFEYGLQPTKWQAISLQRGYPSTFEESASDIPVISVVTDASAGTAGIGSSLITVTTAGPHGITAGFPITIKALASSIVGFNRAEGTFIVVATPTTTTLTYFAKSRVGTSSGQILATSTTQLRQASFYTGASVGTPTFSVQSNGSSGSFTTQLIVPVNSSIISYNGAPPPLGAPLTGTGIGTGTQITGVFGSGGVADTVTVKTSVSPGATSIELVDTSGIIANMAVLDDLLTPNQLVIASIVGNTINLNGPINVEYLGDETEYLNINLSSANNIAGTATNATFSVTITNGNYSSISVDNPGSGYLVGDTLLITGNLLGGASPANDLYLKVTAIGEDSTPGSLSEIIPLSASGTGSGTFSSLSATQIVNPFAINGSINILRSGGTYTYNSTTSSGSFIYDGERYLVLGTSLGGASPANNAIVTVAVSPGAGGIGIGTTISGTAATGGTLDVYSTVAVSQSTTTEIPVSSTISYSSIATIEVVFNSNHGLVPGASIMTTITSSGTNHNLAQGPFFVTSVISLNTIRFVVRSPGTVSTAVALDGVVYIRPDAFFSHRPFDGGVQLGTGGPQYGGQAIRQSKKYIRYQSGKGAMYNTGALFAPSFDIRSITAAAVDAGSLMTVITDDSDHGLQAGAVVRVTGVQTTGYDGDYTVNEIIDERTFRIVARTNLGSTTAIIGPQCQVSLLNWQVGTVRTGPFDDQNGIFFQYDGQDLSVGRRTSTFQIAGTISIQVDNNTVTGVNTRFYDQLQEGDRIVIRGMTHVVANISSNTAMTVTPDFRGVRDISGVKVSKVQDLIIPQREWNLDRCDGTGPSGYNIDITKMQMVGIQFSWYGAGFIDWMLRGPEGNYVFCHRLKGNNLNTEAYMRTGNLPVRYEVLNEGPRTRLNGAINNTVTSIPVDDVSNFPTTGTVYVNNEIISYTGKNALTNSLTGCTRATSLSNFAGGATRTYTAGAAASHNDNQGVILINSTASPIISHWGSAYLIDGLFDEDRGYIFNYAATGISASTTKATAFLIRLAPSVSNAVIGDLGDRELLNRAQLLLQSISITANPQAIADTGALVIEGVLNPSNYPINPGDIIWNGLQGSAGGGQPSFAQIASGGSVLWSSGAIVATTTATVQGAFQATFTAQQRIGFANNLTFEDGTNEFFLTNADFDASGLAIGDIIISETGAGAFPAGTTIANISRNNEPGFTRFRTNRNYSGSDTSGTQSIVLQKSGTAASYNRTNFLYFTSASWIASGATVGTRLDSTVTSFPSNTVVQSVSIVTLGGTIVYLVSFNQASNTTINAASTITFNFSQPPFALPGEQVFSFISNPGESAVLGLEQLKELTNTTIGGRGTFPNGPDVLAINVYKVSGPAVPCNIILRWGEAQA